MNTSNTETTVSIVRASSYKLEELREPVANSLRLIGGLGTIIKPGSKVFVKINHLSPPSPPEKGIVTHPVFTEAVLEILLKAGADVTVGDDIDGGNEDGFIISGYRSMCERVGVKLINLREDGFVAKQCKGVILSEIYISKVATEADVIINLPKFKTHSLATFTGGVKNLYGVIPAGKRHSFHAEYSHVQDFCHALVDIYSVAKPQITIMDGIVAMEGEGPGSGHLRNLGLILASSDSVSLDAVACKIIGLKPDDVLTTRFADERGLGVGTVDKIRIVGEKLETVVVKDFKFPATISQVAIGRMPRPLLTFAINQITARPRVLRNDCVACAECVKVCPAKAIRIHDKKAYIDKQKCIRCMCCHEVCRYSAIAPRRELIGEMIYQSANTIRKLVKK